MSFSFDRFHHYRGWQRCVRDTFLGGWWSISWRHPHLSDTLIAWCLDKLTPISHSHGSSGDTCQDPSAEEVGAEGDHAVLGPMEDAIQAVHEARRQLPGVPGL